MRSLSIAAVALGLFVAARAASDPGAISEDAVRSLRDGRADSVWSMLRQSADNTIRSLVIRDLSRLGVRPVVILQRLEVERDVSARRALILALGGYDAGALAPAARERIRPRLAQLYSTDPDSGIHSATGWALRTAGYGATPAPAPTSMSGWYVTAEGHTLAVVRGPSSVHMGSPADEEGRVPAVDSPAEPQHTVTVSRSFAIGITEVTVAEFRRFLEATPAAAKRFEYTNAPQRMADVLARFSPSGDHPQIAVTWYEAAMYCNWLSAREGLPASEWAYGETPFEDGMRLPADYLRRTGYRLPTEAEWELAARAGTSTARFFGASTALLPEYAWFAKNPPRSKDAPADPNDPTRTEPVGRVKPNDLGLFDMYGNVWEWTQDRVERFQTPNVGVDVEDSVLIVRDTDARTRRGGAYSYPAAMARSAARGTVNSFPTTRRDNVGFRIARTVR
jgi:formylglycine-generating enzyme required for sulfatase activity